MAGTVMISKKLLDRLRAAFRRYGEKVLDDPAITIDFYPTQLEEYFGVLLTSPKFEEMRYGERQNSIWDFFARMLLASPMKTLFIFPKLRQKLRL